MIIFSTTPFLVNTNGIKKFCFRLIFLRKKQSALLNDIRDSCSIGIIALRAFLLFLPIAFLLIVLIIPIGSFRFLGS